MSEAFVTSPLATKSTSPGSSAQPPQQGFQLEPSFGELETPSFGLQLDNIIEPHVPLLESDDAAPEARKENLAIDPSATEAKTEDNLVAPKTAASQVDTNGETVQDVSNSTSTLLELDGDTNAPRPDSFISYSWPYLLVGFALVGWLILQMLSKSAPNFKHHKIEPRDPAQLSETGKNVSGRFKASQRFQKTNDEGEAWTAESSLAVNDVPAPKETNTASSDQPSQTGKQLTGQFKVAERFQKPKTTGESSLPVSGSPELPEPSKVNAINSSRPADDEFEVEFGDSFSDSDVLDPQDAAEIVARVDARQAEGLRGPSARFKAEIGEKTVSPKDPV